MKISTPDGTGRGHVRSAVVTLVLVTVIILGAGVFAARTDGARALAADRLSKQLGSDVSIESMHIGWPYALVLENVESADFAAGAAGFRADEVRVGWSLRGRRCLAVHRAVIRLTQMADGGWQPAVFGKMGPLPEGHVSDLSGLTRNLRKRTQLEVTEGRISWMVDKDQVTALADGIAFDIVPVKLPGKRAHYYSLQVYSAQNGAGAARLHDLRREWLVTEDADYILTVQTGPAPLDMNDRFWRDSPGWNEGKSKHDQQGTQAEPAGEF